MHHLTLNFGMPGEGTSSAETVQQAYRGAASSTAWSRLQPPASAWKPIYLPGHVPRTDKEAQLQGPCGLPLTAISHRHAFSRGSGGGRGLGRCCVSDGGLNGGQECV